MRLHKYNVNKHFRHANFASFELLHLCCKQYNGMKERGKTYICFLVYQQKEELAVGADYSLTSSITQGESLFISIL